MLVGCSHLGVARTVSEAERVLHGRVRLVIGGFHLAWAPRSRVVETVMELHSLGVEEAAPIHCSGSLVREAMEQMCPGMLLGAEAGDTVVVSASGGEGYPLPGVAFSPGPPVQAPGLGGCRWMRV